MTERHAKMNRRIFLQSVVAGSVVCASASAQKVTPSAAEDIAIALYDLRFPSARAAVRSVAQRAPLRAVNGDVTALIDVVQAMDRQPRRRIVGVTAESVPFCLEQMARINARPHLITRRLSGDLFIWSLTHS